MRRIAATVAVAVALLFSVGAAWADYDDGVAAAQRGDYATALQEWRPLAEQGHSEAQMQLAAMYFNGMGVSQEFSIGAKWIREAARQGNTEAMVILGTLHMSGQGVPQDIFEGVRWIRKASKSGDVKAQATLGSIIAGGRVPSKDHLVEAYLWLSLAVDQGARDAQLGVQEGVPEFLSKLKKNMTPAQIAKAQALAAEWWEKHNN